MLLGNGMMLVYKLQIPRKRTRDTQFLVIRISITFNLISLKEEFLITRSQRESVPLNSSMDWSVEQTIVETYN